jgi:diadenosine tetraphosphate (Ap4A) HIT family hydrolase
MNSMTHSITSSKFSWLTEPGQHARPSHDVVVAENADFVALPSLGSLVPLWTIIVPRRPMTTLSSMNDNERASFISLRDALVLSLSPFARCVFEFEHGGSIGSIVSCGVDQAHLHVVPLNFDLMAAAKKAERRWEIAPRIEDLGYGDTSGKEYLFIQSSNSSLILFPEKQTSQWFRRLIANECGTREWDYKVNPELERMRETARILTRSR